MTAREQAAPKPEFALVPERWVFAPRRWIKAQAQSFVFALGEFSRAFGSATLTVLVIAVALAFPAGLYVLLKNAAAVADSWDGREELSIFLHSDTAPARAAKIAQELRGWPEFEAVRLISPEEALAEFEQKSGMSGVMVLLDGENPLPTILAVTLADHVAAAGVEALLQRVLDVPGVEEADLDIAWLERLRALINLVERAVKVLSAVLAIGVLLIVGNTIRVGIDTRRDEIEMSVLFGATHGFIRRPFLYGGLLIGGSGAAVAWVVVETAIGFLRGPAAELGQLYATTFTLDSLAAREGCALILVGCALGVVGATVAVGRHLKSIAPK